MLEQYILLIVLIHKKFLELELYSFRIRFRGSFGQGFGQILGI